MGGRGGRGARLCFIVRSKPRPSGQRKNFRSTTLLSQATDQCSLSPPLPHGLEHRLVPAKPWVYRLVMVFILSTGNTFYKDFSLS